jgi:hypothetical protein
VAARLVAGAWKLLVLSTSLLLAWNREETNKQRHTITESAVLILTVSGALLLAGALAVAPALAVFADG